MKVTVTTDHRFFRTPDGATWTDGLNSYPFWTRYLKVFDEVQVMARIRQVDSAGPGYLRASGRGVNFSQLPNYTGAIEYLFRAGAVRKCLRTALEDEGAVILRVSSQIANTAAALLRRRGKPYGLEVVNDPYDVFAPGAVRYHARPIYRWWFTQNLRRQCRYAAGVAYVTDRALQARYPCPACSMAVSDVAIPPAAIVDFPRSYDPRKSASAPFRLITVASLAQMYKAPDILILAAADCVRRGLDLTLEIVGDGRYRGELEQLAVDAGLGSRVRFAGQVPAGKAVRERLDAADLFVLPSYCEGLPRAMVEAMARALPCIGSAVGGIPELIAATDLVPAGSVPRLAAKIREVLSSPERMTSMSIRNWSRSADFREDQLESRRHAFFEHIRDATSRWQPQATPAARFAHQGAEQC